MKALRGSILFRILNISITTPSVFWIFCEAGLAAPIITCEASFANSLDDQYSPKFERLIDKQARQFVQLLISTQSEPLTSSERGSRLQDANRIFKEITASDPKVLELVTEEWLNWRAGSVHRIEARRTRLIFDIQTLEEQLLSLRNDSLEMAEWRMLEDSEKAPGLKSTFQALLKSQDRSKTPSMPLVVKDNRYIFTNLTSGPNQFDGRAPSGHRLLVIGARMLSDETVLSWSSDHTLIMWKLKRGKFVVDQILGETENSDPAKGHTHTVMGAQVLGDGRLISWSYDRSLILWRQLEGGNFVVDQRIGEAFNTDPMVGHVHAVNGVKMLPSGKLLSWSDDKTLILWTVQQGAFVLEHRLGKLDESDPEKGHASAINGAQSLSDGRIISWSGDNTLVFWKFENGKFAFQRRLGERFNTDPSKGHTAKITRVYELTDGTIISLDLFERLIIWGYRYPDAIESEIKRLSVALEVLNLELIRLEAQTSSVGHTLAGESL